MRLSASSLSGPGLAPLSRPVVGHVTCMHPQVALCAAAAARAGGRRQEFLVRDLLTLDDWSARIRITLYL